MASDIRIRPAVPEDAEALCRLNRDFNGADTADTAMIRERLLDPGPEICLVCETSGMIIGFVCGLCCRSLCYVHPVSQITEPYVQPNARRRGAGESLVRAMIGMLHECGAAEIMLLTGDDNTAAQAVYEKCVSSMKKSAAISCKSNEFSPSASVAEGIFHWLLTGCPTWRIMTVRDLVNHSEQEKSL